MEIFPGIYSLSIPLPNNPMGTVQIYLVKTPEGCLLIDTGWNTDEAFEALRKQLADAGVSMTNIRYIAITHIHPDHYGLVGRLEKQTSATLIIHELERALLRPRYMEYQDLLEEMETWLAINGVPTESRPKLQRASLEMLGLVDVAMPDQIVHGGEHIRLGDFDFEVIWTPGHSPGHICLYDRAKKILFSGDHILAKITPNISMNSQTHGNPLVDYLNSLRQVAKLPVEHVFPAHGPFIHDLPARVDQIYQHHENRLHQMLENFNGRPRTAYQVAVGTKWFLPWEELPPFSQRMAVTETLAHLELLVARGSLTKTMQDGIVWYALRTA